MPTSWHDGYMAGETGSPGRGKAMTTTMITIDGKKFKICDQSNLCKTTARSQATRTAAIKAACTSPAMAECGAVLLPDWNLTIHAY